MPFLRTLALGCLLLATGTPQFARAQPLSVASWTEQVERFALESARRQHADKRIEIQVGTFDPRLRLAPCRRAEPYLPAASRLWGRSRVGLRCLEGANAWNVTLPVHVKVYGSGWVASTALQAGTPITNAQWTRTEVDLADNASGAIVDLHAALGRTLARAIGAGQSLRESHLRARVWFVAGDTVKVVARGSGYQVTGAGQALTVGIEGQPARVRTESGRVVIGTPVAQREIDLTP